MQIKEHQLPARRHPEVVSKAGSFTSQAQDYVPPAELDAGLIAGHPWGVRTISIVREQIQYMVYDKLGRNVLSCCPTPELAAQWAAARLERESILPENLSPRLAGMSFGHKVREDSHLLIHTVIDADGAVVAESDDGRAVAASLAEKAVVSRVDCLDASEEEFASTVVFAMVTSGVGKRDLPLMYQNDLGSSDQDAVNRALREIWRADPRLQQTADSSEIMPSNPDMAKFVNAAQTGLLRYAAKKEGAIKSVDLTFGEPARVCRFVFHSGALGKREMLGHLYQDYLQSVQERQAEQGRPARPVE